MTYIIYLILTIIIIGLFLLFYYLFFKKKIMIEQKKICKNCKNCVKVGYSSYGCTSKFKTYTILDYVTGKEKIVDNALDDEYYFNCGRNRCYDMYGKITCHYKEKEEK